MVPHHQTTTTTTAPPTCAHCNHASPTLQVCNHCKFAFYCNRECQKADWKWHKGGCKSISGRGDVVLICVVTNDPYQPRAFQTFLQYMDDCKAAGEMMEVPHGCYTEKRTATGTIQLLVNEEKYQELQRRKAEAKEKTVKEEAAEEKAAKSS
jgi:hypothetical protein